MFHARLFSLHDKILWQQSCPDRVFPAGVQVAEQLARQSLTNAARVPLPAGDLIPAL